MKRFRNSRLYCHGKKSESVLIAMRGSDGVCRGDRGGLRDSNATRSHVGYGVHREQGQSDRAVAVKTWQ